MALADVQLDWYGAPLLWMAVVEACLKCLADQHRRKSSVRFDCLGTIAFHVVCGGGLAFPGIFSVSARPMLAPGICQVLLVDF